MRAPPSPAYTRFAPFLFHKSTQLRTWECDSVCQQSHSYNIRQASWQICSKERKPVVFLCSKRYFNNYSAQALQLSFSTLVHIGRQHMLPVECTIWRGHPVHSRVADLRANLVRFTAHVLQRIILPQKPKKSPLLRVLHFSPIFFSYRISFFCDHFIPICRRLSSLSTTTFSAYHMVAHIGTVCTYFAGSTYFVPWRHKGSSLASRARAPRALTLPQNHRLQSLAAVEVWGWGWVFSAVAQNLFQ